MSTADWFVVIAGPVSLGGAVGALVLARSALHAADRSLERAEQMLEAAKKQSASRADETRHVDLEV